MEHSSNFSMFFMWMGPYKWPMIIVSAIVIVLIIKKTIDIIIPGAVAERKRAGVNAILFWGSFSFALGIFVQTVSIWTALNEIIKAADISPVITLMGFYGSFCPTIFGAGTLLLASLAWWALRWKTR